MHQTDEQVVIDMPEAESTPPFICNCDARHRSACKGLPFYRIKEGKQFCVLHYPDTEKVEEFRIVFEKKKTRGDFDFREVWFPEIINFQRFDFQKKADFSSATFGAKADFSFAKFSAGADFSSATFSEEANFIFATFSAQVEFRSAIFSALADFRKATFSEEASFTFATFSALADFRVTTFSAQVEFSSTTFSAKADFGSATFSAQVKFRSATFSAQADFRKAAFSAQADFTFATFSAQADFSFATFSAQAGFTFATFKDYLVFSGTDAFKASSLDLQHAKIEKPERISFLSVALYPHWFVNVDSRKFAFTDITWPWPDTKISSEIAKLQIRRIKSPYRLFSKACRELALNAEENHLYEDASKFRFMAMQVQRLESWRGWAFWKLRWWYWLASGYGERAGRAALVLVGVWLVFALIYTKVGFEVKKTEPIKTVEKSEPIESSATPNIELGHPLTLPHAMIHSLNVMALQRPEPKGETIAAKATVAIETILGPLQAALLALAIRRKFMR